MTGFGDAADMSVRYTRIASAQQAEVPSEDAIIVSGAGVRLERLVANLLENSKGYSVAGGTMEISTTADAGTSILRVVNRVR